MTDYLLKVQDFYRAQGWPGPASPATLLSQWESFVQECEEGYRMDLDEYQNDLQIRSRIDALLTAPELQGYRELEEFRSNVGAVDSRFRASLDPGHSIPIASSAWWRRGVPKRVGEQLLKDLRERYGLK